MPYVKTMKRTNKDGTVRIYYYLAESYREKGKMKTRILHPLTAKEAEDLRKETVRKQFVGRLAEPSDVPVLVQTTLIPPTRKPPRLFTLSEVDHYLLSHGEVKGIGIMAYKKARVRTIEAVNARLAEEYGLVLPEL